MCRETRNQRRSRRRKETKNDREHIQNTNLLNDIVKDISRAKCTLVFLGWHGKSIMGYVYNHPKFASGSFVTTASVVKNLYYKWNAHENRLWVVHTKNTLFKVSLQHLTVF